MRMEFDTTEIHDPREPRVVIDNNLFRYSTGRKRECDCAQPFGPVRRRALLIKGLTLGAINEPLQHNRPIADSIQSAGCNRKVIPNQINFQNLGLFGEVRFVRMGDADLTPVDRQGLGRFVFLWSHGFIR